MDGANLMVFYYATANRVSPFVALIGRWTQRSAMMRSISGHGVYLGGRPALADEAALHRASTRHASLSWASLRDMLWTHRSEELEKFYPILLAGVRLHRRRIRQLAGVVAAKKRQHHHRREQGRQIAAGNLSRQARAATAPQP